MSLPIPKFTKSELKSILALLNEELCHQGLTGEICIVGGGDPDSGATGRLECSPAQRVVLRLDEA